MKAKKPSKPLLFRIVTAGIIWKNNQALLLQRPENEEFYPGIWELPGGTRNFNESSTDALTREVREETGLDITSIKPIPTFDYVLEKHNQIVDTTQINFLATINDPLQKPRVSLEHKNIKWFTLKEIKALDKITEETRRSIIEVTQQDVDTYSNQSL